MANPDTSATPLLFAASVETPSLPPIAPPIASMPLTVLPPFGLVDELLRDRSSFLRRLAESDDLDTLARTMLVTILACGAAFGATLGLAHGGWQMLFAAVKLPLAVLFTAGLASPALSAMQAATGARVDVRRDFALVLGSLAFGSVVLAALAPLLVLAWMIGTGYHDTILLTFACCGIAGLATLQLFRRGHSHGSRRSSSPRATPLRPSARAN